MASNAALHREFLERWRSQELHFPMQSSGSTGAPSRLMWERKHMIWSAERTREAWFHCCQDLSQLCVLPLDKAGGLMQAVRAEVWGSPIAIREASAVPNLEGQFSLVSLTPMQLHGVLQGDYGAHTLAQFHTVLLGGGPLDPALEQRLLEPDLLGVRFIHTFGMSETYSHFAGRVIAKTQEPYRVIPGYQWKIASDGELQVLSPCTQEQWLETRDLVQAQGPGFRWIGRRDFVVNSGAVKIHIEETESMIAKHLGWSTQAFFLWKEADPMLGERLVLVFSQHAPENRDIDWSFLPAYHKPKQWYLCETPLTQNGKWMRAASFEVAVPL